MTAVLSLNIKNGSTTEEDQKAVGDWLKANKALKDTEVGKLVDAWYE